MMVNFRKWILSSLTFLLLSGLNTGLCDEAQISGASLSQRDRHVEARLLSDRSHIQPGKTWWVALELKHDPTWHTYWKNGGDAGVPTLINWTLPEGITAGPIQWETPQIVKMGRLDVYGYEGTCLLLTQFKSDPNATFDKPINIEAFVNWMMCARTCLPGKGVNLNLQLGMNNAPLNERKTKWSRRIKQAASKLPELAPPNIFQAHLDVPSETFALQWETFPEAGEVEDVYYFDLTEQITSDEPQSLEQTEQGWKLSLPRASYASSIPNRMKGWLRWKFAGEDFRWARLDLPLK
jgi:DsbC/DsbD-like thiol-disulfide interchange protein